jgi:hypothetical protein
LLGGFADGRYDLVSGCLVIEKKAGLITAGVGDCLHIVRVIFAPAEFGDYKVRISAIINVIKPDMDGDSF